MRKKPLPITSLISWLNVKEKRAAIRRSKERFGNYGLSLYVRSLVNEDIANSKRVR